MPRTLAVSLSGELALVRDLVCTHRPPGEDVSILPLSTLAQNGFRRLARKDYSCIAIAGSPPTAEIGYGIAVVVATIAAPKEVLLVDVEAGSARSYRLPRYLAKSGPAAIAQLLASGLAIGAQAVTARAVASKASSFSVAPVLRRVLYLRPSVGSASTVGGSITHSHGVIRALREEGVDVAPVTTDAAIAATAAADPDPPCEWRLTATTRILYGLPASAAAADDIALVRAGLESGGADVIYQRHSRFALSGALLAQLTRRPLFLEYNGSEEFVGRYWNPTPLKRQLAVCERAALAAAVRIFVVSEADRQDLMRQGIADERIVLNPNGVDVARFAKGGGEAIRTRLDLGREALLIGFVGSFGPWHGTPVLARAFSSVAMQLPQARLLLVGAGPEMEATRQQLAAGGMGEHALFVGRVAPSEIPLYLDACDVLVSPHVPLPDDVEFFGSPTKLFEYMAAGKAIVASRLGQIADVLEHGRTGLLVKPGDADALAAALIEIAAAPRIREELGVAARKAAASHTWQTNAERVIEAYRGLDREP